jgi:hypothetical protein
MGWYGDIAQFHIDEQLWAAVEWSEKRQAWCIEDAEGRCLSHASHIRGKAASKKQAIELAKAMISDGRMPTPEEAKQQRKERLERQREKRETKRDGQVVSLISMTFLNPISKRT